MLWSGPVMSGFVALFLLVVGGARMAGARPYVEGMTKFGWDVGLASWVAMSLLVPTILYLFPRTAVLGVILITGYLGGATATQVRVPDPWFLSTPGFCSRWRWAPWPGEVSGCVIPDSGPCSL
jgi:hypothetical protein